MNKVGVIWVKDSINVGDDVQTIAMTELVKSLHPNCEIVYFDRESLADTDFSTISHLIVSGWFLKKPSEFPTEIGGVKVLFISFHLTSSKGVPAEILSEHRLDLWKQHAPIGCRDRGTMRSFQGVGISAYFSGCATLTLKPRAQQKEQPYVLVADPFYYASKGAYERHQVKRLLGKNFPLQIVQVENTDLSRPQKPMDVRFRETQSLLQKISNAQFVLTSRIHIALPAIAMGTNVVFVHAGYDRKAADIDRFDGILDLFHVISGDNFFASSRKRIGKVLRFTGLYNLQRKDISHLIPQAFYSNKDANSKRQEAKAIAQDLSHVISNFLTKD